MQTATRFGPFGGTFVPQILMPALTQLEAAWLETRKDDIFKAELSALLTDYAGRPTPLTRCANLSGERVEIYLKREDRCTAARTRPTRCWPSAAGQAHGQDPGHRRDRRRSARRRLRHRRRTDESRNRWSTWVSRTSSGRSRTSSACG